MDSKLSVKIVGLGGIGSWLAHFIALELSAYWQGSQLSLIDGDRYQPQNRRRQALCYSEEAYKACAVKAQLSKICRDRIVIHARQVYLDRRSAYRFILDGDIVLLCADNHQTRCLVSQRCQDLDNVTLLSGGNEGSQGCVLVHIRRDGQDLSGPIEKYHPDISRAGAQLPVFSQHACEQRVGDDPQILVTNVAVAQRMYQIFWAILHHGFSGSEYALDVAKFAERVIP